ncbi:hypothetical protein [Vitiosangium sp. GDMCC 1.1324]|uniref:hypothetical protein n=1 Tax=Vitiosangium sp. (strain GDMCC 1.1324) TaxID=2138576 RepID=UPI000D3B7707|nr:hypothetical protein [Vitiosangium sp. GDMCC 1.1324]PTL84241.1 hypothetical protein DAT35_12480 [Vitiosangium sp. GDMCC 1.1324]
MASTYFGAARNPRPEAAALSWWELLPTTRKALEELVHWLDSAYTASASDDSESKSQEHKEQLATSALVSGDRGFGKTTILLSTASALRDPVRFLAPPRTKVTTENRPPPDGKESKRREDLLATLVRIKEHIVWLDPLDMDPLPAQANLLATLLVRVRNALDVGRDSSRQERWAPPSLLEESLNEPYGQIDKLVRDATFMWEDLPSLGQDPRQRADQQIKAAEIYATFRQDFFRAMDAVSRLLATRRFGRDPKGRVLLVLPIDNVDRSTHHIHLILKLTRMVASRRLWFVLASGHSEFQLFLERAFQAELTSPVPNLVGPRARDETLAIARRQAAAAMRRVLPPIHRIQIKSVSPQEAWDFQVASVLLGGEEEKDKLSSLLRDLYLPKRFEESPTLKCFADLFDIKERLSESVRAEYRRFVKEDGLTRDEKLLRGAEPSAETDGPIFTYAATLALTLSARTTLDLWQALRAVIEQRRDHSEDGGKHGQEPCDICAERIIAVAEMMLRTAIDESELPGWASEQLLNRIMRRNQNGDVVLDLTGMPLQKAKRTTLSDVLVWDHLRFAAEAQPKVIKTQKEAAEAQKRVAEAQKRAAEAQREEEVAKELKMAAEELRKAAEELKSAARARGGGKIAEELKKAAAEMKKAAAEMKKAADAREVGKTARKLKKAARAQEEAAKAQKTAAEEQEEGDGSGAFAEDLEKGAEELKKGAEELKKAARTQDAASDAKEEYEKRLPSAVPEGRLLRTELHLRHFQDDILELHDLSKPGRKVPLPRSVAGWFMMLHDLLVFALDGRVLNASTIPLESPPELVATVHKARLDSPGLIELDFWWLPPNWDTFIDYTLFIAQWRAFLWRTREVFQTPKDELVSEEFATSRFKFVVAAWIDNVCSVADDKKRGQWDWNKSGWKSYGTIKTVPLSCVVPPCEEPKKAIKESQSPGSCVQPSNKTRAFEANLDAYLTEVAFNTEELFKKTRESAPGYGRLWTARFWLEQTLPLMMHREFLPYFFLGDHLELLDMVSSRVKAEQPEAGQSGIQRQSGPFLWRDIWRSNAALTKARRYDLVRQTMRFSKVYEAQMEACGVIKEPGAQFLRDWLESACKAWLDIAGDIEFDVDSKEGTVTVRI